jgi:hypothetical protein
VATTAVLPPAGLGDEPARPLAVRPSGKRPAIALYIATLPLSEG